MTITSAAAPPVDMAVTSSALRTSTRSLFSRIYDLPVELQLLITDYALRIDFVINKAIVDLLAVAETSTWFSQLIPVPSLLLASPTTKRHKLIANFLRVNDVLLSEVEDMRGLLDTMLYAEDGVQAGFPCVRHLYVECVGGPGDEHCLDGHEQCVHVRTITFNHVDEWDPHPEEALSAEMRYAFVRKLLGGRKLKHVELEACNPDSREAKAVFEDIQRIAAELGPQVEISTCYHH